MTASTPPRRARRPAPPPPRHAGLPVLGSRLEFRRDPLDFFRRLRERHGDVVAYEQVHVRCCHLAHPDAIREVLQEKSDAFRKSFDLQELRVVLGRGLLTSEPPLWTRERRRIQPSFRHERLQGYAEAMVRRTREAAAGWRGGEPLDVHASMMRMTLRIVADALLGLEMTDAEEREVEEALGDVMHRFAHLLTGPAVPAPLRWPWPFNRRLRRAAERLERVVEALIERRRERGPGGEDLLGDLLFDSEPPDRDLLVDEVLTLLLAGHETTALALSWTFHLLTEHPEAADRIAAEADEVWGARAAGGPGATGGARAAGGPGATGGARATGGPREADRVDAGPTPAASDLPRLRWTRQVLQESMRLYPPAWGVGREAVRDVEVGGRWIPRGTQVYMIQWLVHRDPRFFPEPERFRPGRWEAGSDAVERRAYFPFGGGPRNCVGSGFALMEGALALSMLAREWRLERVEDHPVELELAVTLRPRHGLRMVPRRRGGTIHDPTEEHE